jgi:hypothetical protein
MTLASYAIPGLATEAAWFERKESAGRKETEKNILIEKKRENILDSYRPSHGRN